MTLNFPASPEMGEEYDAPNGTTYMWNGSAWAVDCCVPDVPNTDDNVTQGPGPVTGCGDNTLLKMKDGYAYHIFKDGGYINVGTDVAVDYLVIGGGGGGGGNGDNSAGGGGAGGMVVRQGVTLTSGTYPVSIGMFGKAGNATTSSESGGDTTFNGDVGIGGGAGGHTGSGATFFGEDGGCGGAGAGNNTMRGLGSQGFDGAGKSKNDGWHTKLSSQGGCGGGGMASPGTAATKGDSPSDTINGGNGGQGIDMVATYGWANLDPHLRQGCVGGGGGGGGGKGGQGNVVGKKGAGGLGGGAQGGNYQGSAGKASGLGSGGGGGGSSGSGNPRWPSKGACGGCVIRVPLEPERQLRIVTGSTYTILQDPANYGSNDDAPLPFEDAKLHDGSESTVSAFWTTDFSSPSMLQEFNKVVEIVEINADVRNTKGWITPNVWEYWDLNSNTWENITLDNDSPTRTRKRNMPFREWKDRIITDRIRYTYNYSTGETNRDKKFGLGVLEVWGVYS